MKQVKFSHCKTFSGPIRKLFMNFNKNKPKRTWFFVFKILFSIKIPKSSLYKKQQINGEEKFQFLLPAPRSISILILSLKSEKGENFYCLLIALTEKRIAAAFFLLFSFLTTQMPHYKWSAIKITKIMNFVLDNLTGFVLYSFRWIPFELWSPTLPMLSHSMRVMIMFIYSFKVENNVNYRG